MDLPEFFEIASKLKDVERAGWKERGVKEPETSADHSFLAALMVLVFGKGRKLNLEKALRMALIHDLPESIVGDIISKENWEKGGHMWDSEKFKKEKPAMQKIASLAGDREILGLWEEFESQKTPEARFVKDVDRLATVFQAVEYHKKGNFRKPVEGFWDAKALSRINDPELRMFVGSLLKGLEKPNKQKLIRDRIPEIIRSKGGSPKTHIASQKEYWECLKEKLREEVHEFLGDEKKEELADILEVIYTICDFKKIDRDGLEALRKEKEAKRGGFKKGLILDSVK